MKRPLVVPSVVVVCVVLLGGCKEDRRERMAASYSSVSKATPMPVPKPVRAPEKAMVGIDAIPTEEDYEERAATTISDANLARKLLELEKEMPF